jgi:large subunit ribosomal protein L17
MRHRVHGRKLGRPTPHRRALLRSLCTSLFEHGRITTTVEKAKEMRPLAEKMITLGKRNTLHARRQAAGFLLNAAVVKELFETIAARYADRNGGYTRIIKLGFREGDGADLAIIELLGSELSVKKAQKAAAEKAKKEKSKGEGESTSVTKKVTSRIKSALTGEKKKSKAKTEPTEESKDE